MRFGSRLFGASPVSQWLRGGSGGIQSIQSGSITIGPAAASNTATVASVQTANSVLLHLGSTYDAVDTLSGSYMGRLALTNGTTITATRAGTSNTLVVRYLLLEYAPGVVKAVRNGTIVLSGVTSNTDTIADVSTTRAMLCHLGVSTADTSGAGATFDVALTLTNTTTVTATRGSAAAASTVSYRVVEFY